MPVASISVIHQAKVGRSVVAVSAFVFGSKLMARGRTRRVR